MKSFLVFVCLMMLLTKSSWIRPGSCCFVLLRKKHVKLPTFIACLTLVGILGTGQASKSGTDVLLDLLSIGSPSVPSSSSTVDILSSNTSNKTPISPLDDLSPLSLSSRATSNAGPMMDLLGGISPSPLTGCLLYLQFEYYHYFKYSRSTDSPPSLILNRKQWTSLSIYNCF